jgi:acyl transferase domain-containing protein/3-hydroxymyristoyl/3-hydroxydecanoyl-(acyl carrier protein) dehydratase
MIAEPQTGRPPSPGEGGRIAIVAMGGLFPSAPTPERLWEQVLAGADAAREVPPGRWLLDPRDAYDPAVARPDRVYSLRGCFLDEIPLAPSGLDLPADLLAQLDPVFHLALHAGRRAFESGVTRNLDRHRVGVILGNITLPTERVSDLARTYLGRTFMEKLGERGVSTPQLFDPSVDTPRSPESFDTPSPLNRHVPGLVAGVLAKALGLGGGSYTLDAACASSLYALKLAVDELRAGRADAMLAGGVSRPDCLYTQMGFSQLRALSPSGRCSPFDARADGLVVGEGAGIFLLKRLEDALRDGDRIWAVIAGIGLSNDVDGNLLAPSSEGQLRAMHAAYRAAGWMPGDVDYIECHATGTPVGDSVEFQSLKSLWGESAWRRGQCAIGSVKSTVGHLLTAAGAAGVTKVLSAFQAGVLPPTANFTTPAPGLDFETSPFRILSHGEPWHRRTERTPRRAAVSAFGFGGVNAHLLLEEWHDTILPSPPSGGRGEKNTPIAVVGMAAHFGPWKSLRAFQQRVLGGDSPMSPSLPPHWWGVPESAWFRAQGLDARSFAGWYVGPEATVHAGRFRIPPRELQETLPQQLLMLQVAAEALDTAGLSEEDRPHTGVFIGLGLDLNTTNFHFRWSLEPALRDAAGPPLTASRTMGSLGSIVASRIAREFHLGGPSFTISGEESSGLHALAAAVRALRQGEIDRAVVGAVDLAGDVRAVLASHQHRPFSAGGRARPFDADADGTLPGEGAAAVVLKRLDDAVRDGDTIHAVIRGIGVAGGDSVDAAAPDPAAYRTALQRAYDDAGIDPASVGYVEAHGSGHPAEDGAEAQALADFFGAHAGPHPPALGSVKADVGHTGAAAGLASLVKTCLCLDQQMLPPLRNLSQEVSDLTDRFLLPRAPQYWLRDRTAGPRRAGVSSCGVDGNCVHVVLEAWEPAVCVDRPDRLRPLGTNTEALFIIEGRDARTLIEGLGRLRSQMGAAPDASLEALARDWYEKNPLAPALPWAVALVARDRPELIEQIDVAQRGLRDDPTRPLPRRPAFRDRVFYAPVPLGRTGRLAFVFPGSGNDFPGMGRDLAVYWPEVLRRQDAENNYLQSQYLPHRFWNETPDEPPSVRERIFGQVALGGLVCDVVRHFGVRADAVLGYSLGESAGLFALRAWTDRDAMLRAMNDSPLFVRELAGPCDAARRAWRLPLEKGVDWVTGVVDRAPAAVRAACAGLRRVYLLIINTPRECVLGGERGAVGAVVERLGCNFLPLPETSTVHCPVAREVAEAYRDLHRLPTAPTPGVRFYSTALARSFELNSDSAAGSILAQALDTVDFPAVVESAYRDGVRLFLEMGPGASCTRMIDAITGDRPHCARSACVAGADGVSLVLRLLAHLCAERVPVDLAPLYGPETILRIAAPPAERRLLSVPVGGPPFVVRKTAPVVAAPIEPEIIHRERDRDGERERERSLPVPVPHPDPVPVSSLPSPHLANGGTELAALVTQTVSVRESAGHAHAAYLRLSATLQRGLMDNLQFQAKLFESISPSGGRQPPEGSLRELTPPAQETEALRSPLALNREQCLEFATNSIARVLGPDFAPIDGHPTRVRLPDEPLMLVDRILTIEGQRRSLTSGRVVTEHDIHPGAWYLDGGRIATCIAIEAGQADLFLSAYLGIDFQTRGQAVYRLLDAAVTFHRGLPGPGQVIRYDIRIERFFRQGDTFLFKFHFEGTVDGEPLLTMKNGCAGFFTAAELAAGKGVVQTTLDTRPQRGVQPDDAAELPPRGVESYGAEQLDALRGGDAAGCFGPLFAGRRLPDGLRLPGGRMRLVDRVTHLDPKGGRFGIGLIRAEADIEPDAWFLTCHFVDDQVMPGTLMYECCLHTLRIYLLRLGWIAEADGIVCEPVPGVASVLKCRGQVTAATRTVTYEVILKERGYRPEPYAIADALMYADGKLIVEITNMSVRLTGLTREAIAAGWTSSTSLFPRSAWERTMGRSASRPTREPDATQSVADVRSHAERGNEMHQGVDTPRSPALFDKHHILAFAAGKPSDAFGEPYRVFDEGRFVARLPRPPFSFIDRITRIEAEQYRMVAGGVIEAQYDVPPDAWYFAAERQSIMPYAVLLEIALQSCGFLAAYAGSALTSPEDLAFRNLEGEAELLEPVTADAGTLTTRVRLLRVASSGGMIIQGYEFAVQCGARRVYRGQTTFGFFSRDALAQQVGIREARPYEQAGGDGFDYPRVAPFPDDRLRMIDRIERYVPDGGPHGLGYIEGRKTVDPEEWFFKAHFYQDPVWPGSLGLEAFLQLLKAVALRRWPLGEKARFLACPAKRHRWRYRGQVVPASKEVTVQAVVTSRDDAARQLTADGFLAVDGLIIYQMNDFALRVDEVT